MPVMVHSKPGCPYCVRAKELLDGSGIPYEEVLYDPDAPDYADRRDRLIGATGHRTFPQIFVGERFIGGYTELEHLYSTQHLHDLCAKELGITIERTYDF